MNLRYIQNYVRKDFWSILSLTHSIQWLRYMCCHLKYLTYLKYFLIVFDTFCIKTTIEVRKDSFGTASIMTVTENSHYQSVDSQVMIVMDKNSKCVDYRSRKIMGSGFPAGRYCIKRDISLTLHSYIAFINWRKAKRFKSQFFLKNNALPRGTDWFRLPSHVLATLGLFLPGTVAASGGIPSFSLLIKHSVLCFCLDVLSD